MGRILIGNVRNPLADNLTTAENAKYALDAHQGKVLDEKKIDKTSIVNNATTTTTGTVLDGRMGKTLQNGIDELNSNLNVANFTLTNSTYYPVTNVIASGRAIQLQCAGLILKDVPANAEFVIGTLPAAYRPSYKIIKYVLGGSTTSRLFRISIDVDGKVTYTPTADIATGVGVNINETFIAKPS